MNIGIDIGGSHISVGLVENENIIIKKTIDINKENKKKIKRFIEETIVKFINSILIDNKLYIGNIGKIGIAAPGTIIDTKIITNAVNLGLKEFDIYSCLRKYYKYIKIIVKNDAKCAAIAEKRYGNMNDYEDILFLTLGTGVGGAVFLNNKILEPKTCSGIEIGHMVINKNGAVCKCGRKGCFDVYGSMKNFKRKLTKELGMKETSISFEILPEVKKSKNEKIKMIIDEYVNNLAIGISNLINIFEPEIIVIGGSFAYYKEILLEPLIKKIQKNNMLLNKRGQLNIVCAKYLNDSGIIGSANI